jgi:hypothetical protein
MSSKISKQWGQEPPAPAPNARRWQDQLAERRDLEDKRRTLVRAGRTLARARRELAAFDGADDAEGALEAVERLVDELFDIVLTTEQAARF